MIHDYPKAISRPYLLVTFLPYHIDDAGDVWMNRLWLKDLIGHLDYIENLSLLAPKRDAFDFSDPVRMPKGYAKRINFIAIPSSNSLVQALKTLPKTIFLSWRAVGEAFIVHSSVVGWPLPLGWIVNPITLARGKLLFIVIESAPWRITPASLPTWKDKLRSIVSERLASYFVNKANLTLYTQDAYRASLGSKPRGDSVVIPASWIEEDDIVSVEQCKIEERPPGPARFFCASRLTFDKGIDVFLRALRLLENSKSRCEVTIMGSGELRSACQTLSKQLSAVRLKVFDPVVYGEPFFRHIRDNDCTVIPIISDEQPRVVFDSYSQGRPVIASDTDGLREHVINGQTGWLVRPNDPEHLAEAMRMVVKCAGTLGVHRIMARQEATQLTHQIMHLKRWKVLSKLIQKFET